MTWLSTATFAERNVTLDGRPFRCEEWPVLVEPLKAMDEGAGRIIVLMMPPQRGKTLALQLRLTRNIAIEPRRQLWYSKTATDARSLSDSKLKPLLDSCEPVKRVRYTDPDKRGRGLLFRFHTGPVELLSADVVAHRNSRSGRELFLDEAWQYDKRAMAEIFRRADGYRWMRQINIGTTAPDAGHELDVLWESSSKREWHVACPHCGSVFVPEWSEKMMRWERITDDLGRYDVQRAAATVRMIPPCCGQEIEWSEAVKRSMNDTGRGAGYRPTNPHPDPQVEGYRFNVLATDDWRAICAEWLRAVNAQRGGDPELVREFKIKRMVEAWDPQRERRGQDAEIEVGPYRLGDEWADEAKDEVGRPYRFCTVDVQRNHFWAVVRSWSADGRSRLVARAKLLTHHEVAEFAKQHGVIFGEWYEDRMPGGGPWVKLCHSRVFLDGKFSPGGLVPRICAEHGFHCFMSYKRAAFKHSDGLWRIYDEGRMIDPFSGTHRQEEAGKRIWQFFFVADAAKDRMELLRSQNDTQGIPMWTAAADCGDEYKAQMAAEKKVKVFAADGVSWEYRWKRIHPDNHYFDVETMNVVCASMAQLLGGEDGAPAPESQG